MKIKPIQFKTLVQSRLIVFSDRISKSEEVYFKIINLIASDIFGTYVIQCTKSENLSSQNTHL